MRRRTVGGGDEVRCVGCGAPWPVRRARFCGSCGSPLPTRSTRRRGPAGRRRRLRRALLAAGVATLWVGAVVVALRTDVEVADDGVTLPDAADVDTGRGVPADGAGVVRCEPEGCERWRRSLEDGSRRGERVAVVGGRLGLLEGDRFVLLDPATGHELVAEPVTGGVPREGRLTRWRPEPHEVSLRPVVARTAHDPGVFVLADRAGVVQVRGPDGRERWTAQTALAVPRWAVLVPGRLIVAGTPRDGDGLRLVGLRAADGEVVWTSPPGGHRVHDVTAEAVLVERGGRERAAPPVLEVLDPATGAVRLGLGAEGEVVARMLGPRLLVRGAVDGGTDGSDRLLDAGDGSVAVRLDGHLDTVMVTVGRHVVGVLGDEPAGPRGRTAAHTVVAVGPDGEVAWRHDLVPPGGRPRCCARLQAIGTDRVAVQPGLGQPVVVLDVRTGAARLDLPRPDGDEQAWWFVGEVLVRREDDRHRITDRAGAEAWVEGATTWPVLDDPVVLSADAELIGLDLVRAPAREPDR